MEERLITKRTMAQVVPIREQNSYKNHFGHVVLIGGNQQMGGAIQMAARACVNSGAGLTTVITDSVNRSAIHAVLPEVMILDRRESIHKKRELLNSATVIMIGPGFGQKPGEWEDYVNTIAELDHPVKLILDADAINLIAKNFIIHRARFQQHDLIFTPHIGEWRRLCEDKIAPDDLESIQKWVDANACGLILKSERTHIYAPHMDYVYKNTFGNPGMSISGSGDTLAGMVAGLCAQVIDVKDACQLAVGLHSYIADKIYREEYIVRPTKISDQIPYYLKTFQRFASEHR